MRAEVERRLGRRAARVGGHPRRRHRAAARPAAAQRQLLHRGRLHRRGGRRRGRLRGLTGVRVDPEIWDIDEHLARPRPRRVPARAAAGPARPTARCCRTGRRRSSPPSPSPAATAASTWACSAPTSPPSSTSRGSSRRSPTWGCRGSRGPTSPTRSSSRLGARRRGPLVLRRSRTSRRRGLRPRRDAPTSSLPQWPRAGRGVRQRGALHRGRHPRQRGRHGLATRRRLSPSTTPRCS